MWQAQLAEFQFRVAIGQGDRVTFAVTRSCGKPRHGVPRHATFTWTLGDTRSEGYRTCEGEPASAYRLDVWITIMTPLPEEVEEVIRRAPLPEVHVENVDRTG